MVGGGSRQWQTHTHTHNVLPDTQGGWLLGQGSDANLTHVGVDYPQTKLMGYEHWEVLVGVGGAGNGKHTHSVPRDTHGVLRDTHGTWSLNRG